MSKPTIATPPVPDEVLKQLADIAHVPAENCALFFKLIREAVQAAWEVDGLVKQWGASTKDAALTRATQGALALYEALGNLKDRERDWVETRLVKHQGFYDKISSEGVPGLREIAYQLAAFLSAATGTPPPRFPHQTTRPHRRGRKAGTAKAYHFQEFVFHFMAYARTCGGNLPLEKNIGKGRLIEAIGLLDTHLPDGFKSKSLSMQTYQRLKDLLSANERAADELEQDSSGDHS